MTMSDLSLLYKYKDYDALYGAYVVIQERKNAIDDWFTSYLDKFSSSVFSKAEYNDSIRKPYNDMWLEYEENIKQYRICEYYLEALRYV